jgi:DNA replication factor GINS
MDLDELQSVRDRERQTDKLQQLRESFYSDAGEFIQQLRRERERAAERADDPFDSPAVNRLTDEINTAEGTVEAIFERRIGKIVKAASLAAADQPMDAEGMTAEETVLFEDLVDDIVATRHRVFDTLDGETAEGTDGRSDPSPVRSAGESGSATGADTAAVSPADDKPGAEPGDGTGAEPGQGPAGMAEPEPEPESGSGEANTGPDGVAAADLMGGDTGGTAAGTGAESGSDTAPEAGHGADPDSGREPEPGSGEVRAVAGAAETEPAEPSGGDADDGDAPVRKDGGTVARETVRITDDVGEILGVDEREYDLATDDVVQLPAENARPLVERGAAERLE